MAETTFTLTLDGEERRARIRVVGHENGTDATLEIEGVGFGRHEAHVRFDVGAHFDEWVHAEWSGDSHSVPLTFHPLAAIATVDGVDEIRF